MDEQKQTPSGADEIYYRRKYREAEAQLDDLRRQMGALQAVYDQTVNSRSWKMTKPFRVVSQFAKRVLHLIPRSIRSIRINGLKGAWRKSKEARLRSKGVISGVNAYNDAMLAAQQKVKFPQKVTFSVLVPLYNTPEQFLTEMIRSVQAQTYGDWELCLADGSDAEHGYVEKLCRRMAQKDPRIRYEKLEKNGGISVNTNACIDMATGNYIALFDHDDVLHPAALYEMMCAICEKKADFIYTDEATFVSPDLDHITVVNYKQDFAPDSLRSNNYICHFSAFSRELLEKAGHFRPEFDGSQDYDMVLRLTEQAKVIVHIPKVLYYWRSHAASVASDISAKPYTVVAAKKALTEHLQRVGLEGTVEDSRLISTYRIRYTIHGQPLISILIPNMDHIGDLKKCISSIREKTSYPNWEIIVIENNSREQKTFDYYEEIQKQDSRIKVVKWEGIFNYSAINNFGATFASGEHLLLLNNDIEVITPDWLDSMLMYSQRQDVGAVGAMLYYPDDTIQHAGVILGMGGVAGHGHKFFRRGDYGFMGRLSFAQNYSIVTAACLMLRRSVWDQVGGLDESFRVAFNDVDLCMRIRKAGYLVVWTPYAELYHYESKSRGRDDTKENKKRFEGEIKHFITKWEKELQEGDPYYNPNLSLDKYDFSFR